MKASRRRHPLPGRRGRRTSQKPRRVPARRTRRAAALGGRRRIRRARRCQDRHRSAGRPRLRLLVCARDRRCRPGQAHRGWHPTSPSVCRDQCARRVGRRGPAGLVPGSGPHTRGGRLPHRRVRCGPASRRRWPGNHGRSTRTTESLRYHHGHAASAATRARSGSRWSRAGRRWGPPVPWHRGRSSPAPRDARPPSRV